MPLPEGGMERIFATEFGAADVLAMVDDLDAALAWRGGRLVVDRSLDRGTLTLVVLTEQPERTAELLKIRDTGEGHRELSRSRGDAHRVRCAAGALTRARGNRCQTR